MIWNEYLLSTHVQYSEIEIEPKEGNWAELLTCNKWLSFQNMVSVLHACNNAPTW